MKVISESIAFKVQLKKGLIALIKKTIMPIYNLLKLNITKFVFIFKLLLKIKIIIYGKLPRS